jgi:capsular polysaccharide export protein
MQGLDLNDQTFLFGSETMRPLDSVKSIPGLLRGPASWATKAGAISIFSPSVCVRVLEGDSRSAPALNARARAGIDSLVASRVGGDCWSAAVEKPGAAGVTVLVVAPESDDGVGGAWSRLIAAVGAERGQEKVALYVPGASSKQARGALTRLAAEQDMLLIDGPANAWSLIENISSLYTVDNELGFLALLKGIKVRCFGQPFYAGWGLTDDDDSALPRHARRNLEELFAAACLLATDYVNPYDNTSSSFEDACAILADWRRINDANRAIAACLGMSFWKRRRMGDVLRSSDGTPQFCKTTNAAIKAARQRGGAIAVWAAREPADLVSAAAEAGIPVVRIEDGFVRSVGLGANFTPAASIAIDRSGIYFDPTKPSDLEHILQDTEFGMGLVERSRRLIQTLVTRGITKYNTGADMPRIDAPDGRRKLFVPGQVEGDRSVATGGAGIYRNIDLLERVRALNPDAFVIYKPHPDVDAGHRLGAVPDAEALRFADHIIRGVSTAAIIPAVDEIHTLTSLAGFEALIRRRKVVVYGQPFYAGWGLTTDMTPVERRTRKLSLEELIAGSLVLYPRYFDPVTRLPCGPEILIERLSHPELWRPGALVAVRQIQGDLMRRIGNFRTAKTSYVSTAHLDKRQKHVKPA